MIRKANIDDKETIRQLIAMMICDKDHEKVSHEVIEDLYKFENNRIFVLEENDIVHGYIVLKINPFEGGGNLGEIVFLGVDETSRNKGFGIELVDYVETYAIKENIRKLYVKTNPDNKRAVCFWIKRNYQFEARMKNFSDTNIDDYYLGKEINPNEKRK